MRLHIHFNTGCMAVMPIETNPPLIVNADTPLALSVSAEFFKAIRRRHPKKFKRY